MLRLTRLSVIAVALTACTNHALETPNPSPQQEATLNYDVTQNRDLDILFMVDNSGSMANKQANLKANFPALIKVLEGLPGGLPNVHIGVVSSDVGAGGTVLSGNPACNRPGGDKGALQVKSGCGLDPTKGHFLASSGNETQNNFTGKLTDVFGCMAELGTSGCGFEHQLESVRLALLPNFNAENAGFLRDDAYLAIIFITDEDDCSAGPQADFFADSDPSHYPNQTANLRCYLKAAVCGGAPLPNNGMPFESPLLSCMAAPDKRPPTPQDLNPIADYVDFVRSLKKNPDKIIVSGIIGWPDDPSTAKYSIVPSVEVNGMKLLDAGQVCSTAGGATPALRIKEFIDAFGANGSVHTICSDDFSPALKRIGELIALRLQPGCIKDSLVDRDATKDGIQPECLVADRELQAGGKFIDHALPSCEANGNAPPCWTVDPPDKQTDNKCDGGQWRVSVNRGGQMPPADTQQVVHCATCVQNKGALGCPCTGNDACAFGYACTNGSCAIAKP